MKPVHIPFLAGQNEAVDAKILPPGQMLSARNVMMNREGRIVRRRALRSVDTDTPLQEGTPGELRALFGDDLVLVDVPDTLGHAVGRITRFVFDGAFKECMHLVGQAGVSADSSTVSIDTNDEAERRQFLPVGHFKNVRDVGMAGTAEGGRSAISASIAVSPSNSLVTGTLLTDGSYLIELRDSITREVFHTYTVHVDAGGFFIANMQVVASKTQELCAAITTTNTGLYVKVFSTAYPFSELFAGRVGGSGAATGAFVADVTFEDLIVIATEEGGTFSVSWDEASSAPTSGATITTAISSGSLGVSHSALAIQALPDGRIGVLTYLPDTPNDKIKLRLYQNDLAISTGEVVLDLADPDTHPISGGLARDPDSTWHIVLTLDSGGDIASYIRSIYIQASESAFDTASVVAANSIFLVSQPVWSERGVWAAFEVATTNEQIADVDDEDELTEALELLNFASGIQVIDVGHMRVVSQLSDEIGGVTGGDGLFEFWTDKACRPRPLAIDGGFALPVLTQHSTTRNLARLLTFREGHGVATRTRDGEQLVTGGGVFFTDASVAGTSYFSAPPELSITNIAVTSDTPRKLPLGTYQLAAVLEYVDVNGRVWRSAPSSIHDVVLEHEEDESTWTGSFDAYVTRGPGAPNGEGEVRAVLYMTPPNGAPALRRRAEMPLGRPEQTLAPGELGADFGQINTVNPQAISPLSGTLRTLALLEQQEQLYTVGGELGNDAPPPADFVAVGKTRAWIGGLPDRTLVRCSKPFAPGLGIEWSNFDTFAVSLPEEVTGLCVMDETLVVFTVRGVYLVHGDGPNNQGLGEFPPPQKIPTALGCIDARSIAANEVGVWYQTKRGLELLPRGFGAPQWVGQGVRDVTREHPVCRGAVALTDGTVRWAFCKEDESGPVVIVWDQRAQSWFLHDYPTTEAVGAGPLTVGALVEQVHGETVPAFLGPSGLGKERDVEPRESAASWFETGSIRPVGLNAQHQWRTVNVLGEWLGPCLVTLQFAFDDRPYLPQDTITWDLTTGYQPGDPVVLELTLPVMKGPATRFRLSWAPQDATVEATFAATGITVWFMPEDMGPRVPEAQKG